MAREASHVHLVDDGLGNGPAQRLVALPVVAGIIHHDALHGRAGVVAGPAGRFPAVDGWHRHAAAVGVEQDLVRVITQTLFRRVGADGPIGVNLAGLHAGDERMPVVVGAVLRRIEPEHLRRPCVVDAVEQEQLDGVSLIGVDAEVHAAGPRRCAEREGGAGLKIC